MREMTLSAPAKVNLTLEILGRREDGYHDLKSVMTSVSLCDVVTVRLQEGESITVSAPGTDLPTGVDNLAGRAAQRFFTAMGIQQGAQILLHKQIPAKAGLGGGSSDAAAVLRILRELLRPELALAELEKLGASVGSDVPYCVRGGTTLVEGRGERLTSWPALPECYVVLCKPAFGLSTPELFARADRLNAPCRPDHAAVYAGLLHGEVAAVCPRLQNAFEALLTPEEQREIQGVKRQLRQCGASGALMTGSGPTVFGIFRHPGGAQRAYEQLCGRYPQTFMTRPL